MNLEALVRGQTLTERVASAIQEMLISGALAPGERVNEAALAEKLAVSRGPVREATRSLAGAGLLTVFPGRGVFVRTSSNKEIAELSSLVDQMELADREDRIADYYCINIKFHNTIGKIANHSCANRLYNDIHNDLVRGMHNLRRSLAVPLQTNSEHRQIVEAIRAGDIELARRCGEAHVLNGRERWKTSLLE